MKKSLYLGFLPYGKRQTEEKIPLTVLNAFKEQEADLYSFVTGNRAS